MRILLVEDEKQLSDALVNIFKKEKYEVDPVYDGEDGLEYALTNIYDIIILDVMLPKLNGFDVLKSIRNNKIESFVIMLTALYDESNKVKGLDYGADDYLAKPFSVAELLARIRAISRRKGSFINDNQLLFGNITLNLQSYNLVSPTNQVKLSVKEFEIIRYLFEKPNFVAQRDELINKVWGLDNEFESNNLDVYMSFLRKKLVYLCADFTIESVRKVGYELKKNE